MSGVAKTNNGLGDAWVAERRPRRNAAETVSDTPVRNLLFFGDSPPLDPLRRFRRFAFFIACFSFFIPANGRRGRE
jgi:hypothetical protein